MSSSTQPVLPGAHPAGASALLPGLDGLRALALAAVVCFHADFTWARGGFLGVEVFFVLSGFLITFLLLGEWNAQGRLDLARFWAARMRRLLPALLATVAATLLYAVLRLPEEVAGLRADALAGLAYVSNWRFILTERSYFEAAWRPPLFLHLWSLAVEAQFYVLWPLAFAALMRLRGRGAALGVTLALAVGSALLMASWFDPAGDASRVYFGTDTRAAGPLFGAALAFALRARGTARVVWRRGVDAAGVVGLAALGLFVTRLDEGSAFLYRGGFAAVALATALVLVGCVHPSARLLPRLLGAPALRWVGTRSYGLYLWHWPVFMLTRPGLDLPRDLGLQALDGSLGAALLFTGKLLLTGVIAELSYRYVETPVRTRALERSFAALWQGGPRDAGEAARAKAPSERLRWGLGLLAATTLGVTLAHSAATAQAGGTAAGDAPVAAVSGLLEPSDETADERESAVALVSVRKSTHNADALDAPAVQDALRRAAGGTSPRAEGPGRTERAVDGAPATPSRAPDAPDPGASTPAETRANAQAASATQAVGPPAGTSANAQATSAPARPAASPRALPLTAIGDSVLAGAAHALPRRLGRVYVDAEQSRQLPAAVQLLKRRRDAAQLGSVVVIHLGTNGWIRAEDVRKLLNVVAKVPQVLLVNVKAPRNWEAPNNELLAAEARAFPNVTLVDWHATATAHEEVFNKDGIHLRPEGADVYAAMLAAAVRHPAEPAAPVAPVAAAPAPVEANGVSKPQAR